MKNPGPSQEERHPLSSHRLDLRNDVDVPLRLHLDDIALPGDLHIPDHAKGIVVFAHGSGSSRLSPRNRFVVDVLRQDQIGTLLIDLLTPGEERLDEVTKEFRFDIPLLSERLSRVVDWVSRQSHFHDFPIGIFGASTGAAAALIVAAKYPDLITAVVSRGGRPDLAGPYIPEVQAPTLFIVGEMDPSVIALNEQAQTRMKAASRMHIVPGATHLFEEKGALEEVARLATEWFVQNMPIR